MQAESIVCGKDAGRENMLLWENYINPVRPELGMRG